MKDVDIVEQIKRKSEELDSLVEDNRNELIRQVLRNVKLSEVDKRSACDTIETYLFGAYHPVISGYDLVNNLKEKKLIAIVEKGSGFMIFLTEQGWKCKTNMCESCVDRFKCWTER